MEGMRPWLTKYLYSDPNFYIHFELFCTSMSPLQSQLEKILNNLATLRQKIHEPRVIGRLYRMYTHILTHQASQSLDPSLPSFEYVYLARSVISPIFSLSSLKAHKVLCSLNNANAFSESMSWKSPKTYRDA
jgi:hypothetical protein